MFKNTMIAYCVMLMLSTKKKNFSAIGRFFEVIGKVILKLLHPEEVYHEMMIKIAMETFKDARILYLIFDDTLLRKVYSKLMEGSGKNFCTKIGRRITSFKLLAAMISNGHISLPFFSAFLFSDELDPRAKESRADWVKRIIKMAQKYFPCKEIIVLGDGAFGTKNFTGLTDCQSRNSQGLNYHFNASLVALNVAKIQDTAWQKSHNLNIPFSMVNWSRKYYIQIALKHIFSMFDFDQTLLKSHPNYESIINFGKIHH